MLSLQQQKTGSAYFLTLILLITGLASPQSVKAQVLPQNEGWQVTLRDHIATFQEADFDVTLGSMDEQASYFTSDDDRLKYYSLFNTMNVNTALGNKGLRVESSHFTLSAIEANQEVNMNLKWPELAGSAFWVLFDYPGNPYYGQAGGKRRLFVVGAVDMMMLDQAHLDGNYKRSDFLAGNMIHHALAYKACKDILPQDVRDAYEAGLIKMFEKIEQWGPTGIHYNMDARQAVAMPLVAEVVDSVDLTTRADDYLQNQLFSEPPYSPAGYLPDGSYDPGYNGGTINNMIKSQAIDPRSWKPDVIEQMIRLRNFQLLPEEAANGGRGGFLSPTSFAGRTTAGAANDQWQPLWREVAGSAVTDQHIGWLLEREHFYQSSMPMTPQELEDEINASGVNSSLSLDDADSSSPDPWFESHWNEDFPTTGLYWNGNGLWDQIQNLRSSNDPLTKVPFNREEDFIENFNDELVAFKIGSLGGILFHGPVSWWNTQGGTNLPGMPGAQIAALWVEGEGVQALGRMKGYAGDKDSWGEWATMATHAVTGVTGGGNVFSTIRDHNPTPTITVNGTQSVVMESAMTVGPSNPETMENETGLTEDATITRTMQVDVTGVIVTDQVESPGNDPVDELWMHFGHFFGGVNGSFDATIEFKVGGIWQAASTTAMDDVQAVRHTRSGRAPIFLLFEEPQTVRLTPEVWSTSYQRPGDRMRGIQVDMLGDNNEMPINTSITYKLQTSENQLGQSISLQEGWNLVSTTVAPDDPGMEALFEDISADVEVVRNKDGAVYNPGNGTNDIGSWDTNEAYAVFNSAAATLSLQGVDIDPASTPLPLQEGWNWVPYLPESAMPVGEALDSIQDYLVIVKDEDGRVHYPAQGTDNLEQMQPGKGYKIYVDQDVSLTYPDGN